MLAMARAMAELCALIGTVCGVCSATPDCLSASEARATGASQMPDLVALFRFGVDPLELVVRGTAIYWFLFLLFRVLLRRNVGSIGIADVLLLVLIADAAQNAMSGSYETITDGLVLVSTIVGWNHLVDLLVYRSARMRRLLEPRQLILISEGRMLRANMRRELVTTEELLGKLREHGIENLAEVKTAYMESDGEISVIRRPLETRDVDAAAPSSQGPAAP
jgi:uncharacterized membrane protein YcaP (DUF421 family)